MTTAEAADTASSTEAAPPRVRLLVFVAWCVWLLVWLAPAMLLAPRVSDARPWMTAAAAPAAVLAGAALFLVAAWPFLPAFLGFPRGGSPDLPRKTADERGGSGDPPRKNPDGRVGARLIGLSVLEAVVLAALALPFLVVARSVAGGGPAAGPATATAGGLVVLGLGLRTAAAGLPSGAGRRLMFGALLVCGGPPVVAYAAAETLGGAVPGLLEVSPVVALVRAGMDGWPEGAWPTLARLYLWPMVGVGLAVLGLLSARRAQT